MSLAAQPLYGTDLLSRTTLQLDGDMSAPSIARVTRALQRVPGVLLAEINSASSRATVAHDSAVTLASLLAAAAGAGAFAQLVAPPAIAVEGALPLDGKRTRRLLSVAMAVAAGFALVDLLFRSTAGQHWLPAALFSLVWILTLAGASAARRP